MESSVRPGPFESDLPPTLRTSSRLGGRGVSVYVRVRTYVCRGTEVCGGGRVEGRGRVLDVGTTWCGPSQGVWVGEWEGEWVGD